MDTLKGGFGQLAAEIECLKSQLRKLRVPATAHVPPTAAPQQIQQNQVAHAINASPESSVSQQVQRANAGLSSEDVRIDKFFYFGSKR